MIFERTHNSKYDISPIQSMLDLGQYEQLEETCLSILESDQDHSLDYLAHLHVLLSQSYWRRGNRNKGEIYSTIAINSMKEHGSSWSKDLCSQIYGNAGVLYLQAGMFEQARDFMKKALELCNEDLDIDGMSKYLMNLGVLHYYMSEFNEALSYYVQGLDLAKQLGDDRKIASCETNIGMTYVSISEFDKALTYYKSALKKEESMGNVRGIASILGNMGVIYSNLGKYTKALEFYTKAMNLDEQLGINNNHSMYYGNMGVVYGSVSDFQKALDCYQKALKIDEEHQNISGMIRQLGNIATINKDLGDNEQALKYNQQALELLKEFPNADQEMHIAKNLGEIYRLNGEYEYAMEYLTKQMEIAKKIGNKSEKASAYGNLGLVYIAIKDFSKGNEYLQKAISISNELGIKAEEAGWKAALGDLYRMDEFEHHNPLQSESLLKEALNVHVELGQKREQYRTHFSISKLYESQFRIEEAFHHFKVYHDLEREVMNEQAKKQAVELELIRTIEQIERSNQEELIRFKEKERILHDILPIEIANRIVSGETMIAEQHECVSIIFADIVSFTETALRLKAEEVVGTLNNLFIDFDALAIELGIEKIKTLGDAYMGVCGIPTFREDHVEKITHFAFRALDISKSHHFPGHDSIGIRIGLHCGPVIAGVIGGHKYTYDLWGDTVNTASRMESQGHREEVHVSEDFVRNLCGISHSDSVPDTISLSFGDISIHDRGSIQIKGKGEMQTFFLRRI